ncbi:unnamed protein product [Tuber melanosporum]|uniref:(Perigord truffle) hypothetical protein n=1 Tax=Tuber melanosporum (strain Mel28) TaxID=656061 RepID=D5GDP4_TUBMM|nr:uncharacterized protein GSTUM_00006214001 [Tuber melanosporum]CAZ82637.1 unnamed protein product [Tuber melanosporum]
MIHSTSCTFVTGSACESRVGSVRVRSRCRVQKWGKGKESLGVLYKYCRLDSAMQVRVIDLEDYP